MKQTAAKVMVLGFGFALVLGACNPAPKSEKAVSSTESPPAALSSALPTKAPDAASTAEIPLGSGNYAEVLALVRRYKQGSSTFDDLESALVLRKLRPHPLGCAYLMTPSPMPPPGVTFDARMMPKDWEGTWGEVAMAFWLGHLTRDEYDRLHAKAHPQCPHDAQGAEL